MRCDAFSLSIFHFPTYSSSERCDVLLMPRLMLSSNNDIIIRRVESATGREAHIHHPNVGLPVTWPSRFFFRLSPLRDKSETLSRKYFRLFVMPKPTRSDRTWRASSGFHHGTKSFPHNRRALFQHRFNKNWCWNAHRGRGREVITTFSPC